MQPPTLSPLPRVSTLAADSRLLPALIVDDLRSRWSGGALTWVWALLQPISLIALFSLVFGALMTSRGVLFTTTGEYVIYLCAGFFAWLGFSESLSRGVTAQATAATLIKGRAIEPALFPLRAAGAAWALALVGLTLTLLITPFAGVTPSRAWLLLPLPITLLAIMSAGFALILAPIGVIVKDAVQILQLFMPLIFWATPIVYDRALLPEWAQRVQAFNPIAPAIVSIQQLLLAGTIPTASAWCGMVLTAVGAFALGIQINLRLGPRVRDVL